MARVALLVAMVLVGSTAPSKVAVAEPFTAAALIGTAVGVYENSDTIGEFFEKLLKKIFGNDNSQTIKKVRHEIKFRSRHSEVCLDDLIQDGERTESSVIGLPNYDYDLIEKVADQLVFTDPKADSSREYRAWDMQTLLTKLTELSNPSVDMSKILEDAITLAIKLEKMVPNVRSNRPDATLAKLIEKFDRQLVNLAAITGKYYQTKL